MFGADFKKHCELLKQLSCLLDEDPGPLFDIADILFKWCFIKITESQNTSLALSVFDFLLKMFVEM
jgi:hypothetical protein